MATQTVPSGCGFTAVVPPPPQAPAYQEVYRASSDTSEGPAAGTPSLEEVAHTQSDRLFDVRALLAALQNLEAGEVGGHAAYADNVRRIARLADDLVNEIQEAFDPFV